MSFWAESNPNRMRWSRPRPPKLQRWRKNPETLQLVIIATGSFAPIAIGTQDDRCFIFVYNVNIKCLFVDSNVIRRFESVWLCWSRFSKYYIISFFSQCFWWVFLLFSILFFTHTLRFQRLLRWQYLFLLRVFCFSLILFCLRKFRWAGFLRGCCRKVFRPYPHLSRLLSGHPLPEGRGQFWRKLFYGWIFKISF